MDFCRGIRKAGGGTCLPDLALARVVERGDHADGFQMRLFGDLGDLRECGVGNVDAKQQLLPFGRGSRDGDLGHLVVDLIDVPCARDRIADRELLDAFGMSNAKEPDLSRWDEIMHRIRQPEG